MNRISEVGNDMVSPRHPYGGDTGSIRGLPEELRPQTLTLFSQPSPEEGVINPESL